MLSIARNIDRRHSLSLCVCQADYLIHSGSPSHALQSTPRAVAPGGCASRQHHGFLKEATSAVSFSLCPATCVARTPLSTPSAPAPPAAPPRSAPRTRGTEAGGASPLGLRGFVGSGVQSQGSMVSRPRVLESKGFIRVQDDYNYLIRG